MLSVVRCECFPVLKRTPTTICYVCGRVCSMNSSAEPQECGRVIDMHPYLTVTYSHANSHHLTKQPLTTAYQVRYTQDITRRKLHNPRGISCHPCRKSGMVLEHLCKTITRYRLRRSTVGCPGKLCFLDKFCLLIYLKPVLCKLSDPVCLKSFGKTPIPTTYSTLTFGQK